jgi:hypothetical protein
MRRVIWTFVILSPLISIMQADHAPLTAAAGSQLAHTLATHAAVQVATVMHALQTLLT